MTSLTELVEVVIGVDTHVDTRRQLNRALHVIALSRLRHDDRTRTYAEHSTSKGRSRRETIRCLKRYIARDLYRLLEHPA